MHSENNRIQLELIAAKAKQLASDIGRLWDGQLKDGIYEIRQALERITTNDGGGR